MNISNEDPIGYAADAVEALNSGCFCVSLDPAALAGALEHELGKPGLAAMVRERCPQLFSAQPVYVAARHLQRIAQVIGAVESVVALPAFREQALAHAPVIARQDRDGPLGACFGYDFHLAHDRLGLIEINTNAGGAMLNAALARAQRAVCPALAPMAPTLARVAGFEQALVDMFRNEWRLGGLDRELACIAIVDAAPVTQFLYPEFLLFQRLFEQHGVRAIIADPAALEWRGERLWHGDQPIDFVYNRLTDFTLEHAGSAALRAAWLAHGIVLTPNPLAHALYADKRHLALLSDPGRLAALGVMPEACDILREHVPRTEVVERSAAQRLWDARRGLFFKPVAGFGSRATYRGDKLTRRVWDEILAGDYVAQAIVAPGTRSIDDHDAVQAMKFDLRAYAYAGTVQWMAARVYQGQTTNFRTPGGGFAPVYSVLEGATEGMPGCDSEGCAVTPGQPPSCPPGQRRPRDAVRW